MSATGFRFMGYEWRGGREWMLAQGDGNAPHQLLLVPPLFAEMHRCRRLMRDVMRALAALGVDCWLPELPGIGESTLPLEAVEWDDWSAAIAGASREVARIARARPHVASFRGGALIDGEAVALGWWRLAPEAGARLLRDLTRAHTIGGGREDDPDTPRELAGYALSSALHAGLGAALPAPVEPLRTVALADEAGAEATLAGPALWRRAEPGADRAFAERIALDIRGWIDRCDGC